jgi:EF-P beta-lysylation protein EpmB
MDSSFPDSKLKFDIGSDIGKRAMITPILHLSQPTGWQRLLADAITRPTVLLKALDLPPDLLPGAEAADALFPLRVPAPYWRKINRGDPDDPLLRQVLPLDAELTSPPDFVRDPVGDLDAAILPGLLHKYHGRALLITTGACAIHCRYCFRRHFPYSSETSGTGAWQRALQHIRADTSLTEVILSGGDPLNLSDTRLSGLVGELQEIPHLKRLRIHTRLPIVLPQRIDDPLITWLSGCRLRTVVVIHANHPQEFDDDVGQALSRLADSGALLLNQSVLLRGVNDDIDILAQLSEHLFERGVLPYYLHLLDKVAGAAHFCVERQRAIALHRDLANRLPGYLLPRLVTEQAGAASKLAVDQP